MGRAYRVEPGTADRQWRQVHLYGGDAAEGYLFTLEPRRLEDFEGMCKFYSTSPDSSFVRTPVCSLATEAGRVTIAGRRRLIVTESGRRTERRLAADAEERAVLAEVFGVFLDSD